MSNVIIEKTAKKYIIVDVDGNYLTHIHRMYKQYKYSPKKSLAKKMSLSEAKIACAACIDHDVLRGCGIKELTC